jgi:LPPG:FO 2-phospho-L-lactate transferase
MATGSMIVALAGGVGGAKLADGLARVVTHERLTIAVNTGDDFTHLGLHVSPDLDTVMYTLAGRNNTETGWGLAGETWSFMEALGRLGGETWFRLGDQDLATHVERTRRLGAGETLSTVTADLCRRLGIDHPVVPMSDDPVRTIVLTEDRTLAFQDYFVRLGCEPTVTGFTFDGAAAARPSPALHEVMVSGATEAVVICPSNPFVSVDPILAVPNIAGWLDRRTFPVVAVSPIVGGRAIKGPAAKMMDELGEEVSALTIARHYGERLDGLVIDVADEALAPVIEALGPRVTVAETVMKNAADRAQLAAAVIAFAATLEARR